jgi:hypothetical protein
LADQSDAPNKIFCVLSVDLFGLNKCHFTLYFIIFFGKICIQKFETKIHTVNSEKKQIFLQTCIDFDDFSEIVTEIIKT